MKVRRQRLLSLGILVATVVVVVLVALVGLGYLVLPSSTPDPITISGTHYTILEGTNSSGAYWFCFPSPGSSYATGFCEKGYTAGTCAELACNFSYPGVNGYPTTVAPGSTFSVLLVMWNNDTVAHTVSSVVVGPPFTGVRSDPPTPIGIPAGSDDANFEFWITAPSDPGASLAITITISTS
jgi:hypothetical protein